MGLSIAAGFQLIKKQVLASPSPTKINISKKSKEQVCTATCAVSIFCRNKTWRQASAAHGLAHSLAGIRHCRSPKEFPAVANVAITTSSTNSLSSQLRAASELETPPSSRLRNLKVEASKLLLRLFNAMDQSPEKMSNIQMPLIFGL
jgi:hypothetical protein